MTVAEGCPILRIGRLARIPKQRRCSSQWWGEPSAAMTSGKIRVAIAW